MRTIVRCGVAVGIVVLSAACSRNPASSKRGGAGGEALTNVIAEAQNRFASGDFDGAVARIKTAYDSTAYRSDRPEILGVWLHLLLASNRVDQAEAQFLEAAKEDENLVRPSFPMITDFLRERFDLMGLSDWTAKLSAQTWKSADMAGSVLTWHLDANRRIGEWAKVKADVDRCFATYNDADCKTIFTAVLKGVDEDRKYVDGLRFLDMLADGPARMMGVRQMVVLHRVEFLIAQSKWDDALAACLAGAPQLADDNLADMLSSVAQRALRADRVDVVEKLCGYVLANRRDSPHALQQAVYWWIEVPGSRNQTDVIVQRFEDLKKEGIPPAALGSAMRRHFYTVMKSGTVEEQKRLVPISEWLSEQEQDKFDREALQAETLDGWVLLENYPKALAVLKAGFRASDKDWHAMAENKIEAHLALAEGRKEEAIRRFRAFMNQSALWEESTSDPTTGINYSREMTLGRNAKRIGDIYKSMDKSEEARNAYAEARTDFEKALKAIDKASPEYKLVNSELEELPDKGK